jgi:ABC-type transport system involved in multi-copper enzyme maturation permease subunit
MFTTIRYVLMTAIRDRLFAGLIAGILFATGVSAAMGSTAMLEPQQMTLAFTSAAARIIVMLGIIVFIAFHIRSAFENREIDLLLSRPISRSKLILSYWLGFGVVASLLCIPVMAVLALLGILDVKGYAIWCGSLLLESWLVVSMALFAAVTLKSGVVTVLASLGFYTLSRMMGFFVLTSKSGILFENPILTFTMRWIIKVISVLVPRVDFFGKGSWLLYGTQGLEALWLYLAQGMIFIPLLVAATMIDFSRKQF